MAMERIDVENCKDGLQIALHRARYDFVLAKLQPGQSVLELGTGPGTFARELFAKSGTYVGVEFDHATCLEARRNTGGLAEIVQADARNLPFGDNRFSFIVCMEVLEHLGDWKAGVRNIYRCLQPKGTAIVTVPYRRVGGKSKTNPFHLYEPGARELISLFTGLFDQVEVYHQYFEETALMTSARRLHVRRFLNMSSIYQDLSAGLPHATSKLRIGRKSRGMDTNLILVAQGKKQFPSG